MYSESLIFKISLMYTHVFLIMSGFVSFISRKNSSLLSVPRRQEVLTKCIKFWTDEEYVKFIFHVHAIRVIITKREHSINSVNVVMIAYFNI